MGVYTKLKEVQSKVSVPKNRENSFGHYKYRSAEDICEGVKPVLTSVGATIVLSDTIENIGERYYVKATATFTDIETGESVQNTAYARESAEKKGTDDAQISGAASSYARKYCLNGLLLLDDNKDADTDENRIEREERSKSAEKKAERKIETKKPNYITEKEQEVLKNMCARLNLSVEQAFPKGLKLTSEQYSQALAKLKGLGA